MDDHPLDAELLDRIRRGDPTAAADFLRAYEPLVNVILRRMLRNSPLQRQFDPQDLCQSVFGEFFVGLRLGRHDALAMSDVKLLLVTMARNRFRHHYNRQTTQRRDIRRLSAMPVENHRLLSSEPSPEDRLARRESLERAYATFPEEDRRLFDDRVAGYSWQALADRHASTTDGLRMRLKRAVERIRRSCMGDD